MKAFKKFLAFLIGLALMVIIVTLTTSFLLKDIFQNQVVSSVIKTNMVKEAVNDADFEGKDELNELLDEFDGQFDLLNFENDNYFPINYMN